MIRKNESELLEIVENENRVFQGRVFQVDILDVTLQDGKKSKREVIRHNGGAAILPLDDEGNVYVVKQFRSPYAQILTEIPAGKLEPGEDPKFTAIRELSEETGLVAKDVIALGEIYPSPGYCGEILYLYMATGLEQKESHPDPGEELYVEKIPLSVLLDKIDKNEIHDAKTIVAILKAARRLGL